MLGVTQYKQIHVAVGSDTYNCVSLFLCFLLILPENFAAKTQDEIRYWCVSALTEELSWASGLKWSKLRKEELVSIKYAALCNEAFEKKKISDFWQIFLWFCFSLKFVFTNKKKLLLSLLFSLLIHFEMYSSYVHLQRWTEQTGRWSKNVIISSTCTHYLLYYSIQVGTSAHVLTMCNNIHSHLWQQKCHKNMIKINS